jgi:hypothetical protein
LAQGLNRVGVQKALAVIGAVALLLLGVSAYRWWYPRAVQVERNDGLAIARVVDAKLSDTTDLRVTVLAGTIATDIRDVRVGGVLQSRRTAKLPFTADYFVDLSKLERRDFLWNGKDRLLTIVVPDVRVAAPNIDETRAFDVRTTGVFVTRGAMETMARRASNSAQRIARAEAGKPVHIRRARDQGRRAIAGLFERPLRVAGIDATVRVRYAGEATRNDDQWDLSRSLEEIFAEGRE